METAMIVGLSRQMTLRRAMEVTANNIANSNTTGYKAEKVAFAEYMHKISDAPNNTKDVSMVLDQGLFRIMSQGALQVTGGPMDLAIEGPGYFKVETDEGTRYTRGGRFGLNESGQLVTRDGHRLLDSSGNAISLDATEETITISSDGAISSGENMVAQLSLVEFKSANDLKKSGSNLFKSDVDPAPLTNFKLTQGALEMSNVQAIVEMTNMIDIMRAYQSANKLVETGSELTRRVVRVLGEEK